MKSMLLDTNALIWYELEPERLSKRVLRLMENEGNFASHVSLWEMAVKKGSGRLDLLSQGKRTSAKQFMLNVIRDLRLSALPLEFDDLADVEGLPLHHKDPFDRLLVVQAKRHNLPIISPDEHFDDYGIRRVW